jgi:hypothetical protein
MRAATAIAVVAMLTAGCGSSPDAPDSTEICSGFGDWQMSPYVLRFPAGASYFVDQGNCSPPGNGHTGVTKYGYDFLMPIGTPFYAARGGRVTQVEESHFDGQVAATGFDNLIVIQHDDGTTTLYGHLTHDGAIVTVHRARLLIRNSQRVGRTSQPVGFTPICVESGAGSAHDARYTKHHMDGFSRPPRVVLVGARVQLGNTVADLVNVSRTGVLVRAGQQLSIGSEWPLTLEVRGAPPATLTGRVVRCGAAHVSIPGGSVLRSRYDVAFAFVDRSPAAQAILDALC